MRMLSCVQSSSNSSPLELHFLGTGTSAGVPMIGCRCEVCTSVDPRDARTRCSVVIRYGSTSVLVDATPELRLQCVAQDIDDIDAVVFTHAHADHIMGIDDLRRFNAIRNAPLDCWMDESTSQTVLAIFGYGFRTQHEPGVFRPQLVDRRIVGPFEIAGRTWTPIPLLHGRGHVLGFRIGDLAYCTDVSAIPESSRPLLDGLEVLVLDALQDTKHPTHFNIDEALEAVERHRPARTLFTHMSHRVLHARDEPKLPAGVGFAYDGLRVSVPATEGRA